MSLYRKAYMLVEKHESKMCLYRKTYMIVEVKCVYIEKHTCYWK